MDFARALPILYMRAPLRWSFALKAMKHIPWLAVLLPLAGCYNPHVVNEQDAFYCEGQGFRAGTDANVDCALKRASDRKDAGKSAPDQLVAMAPVPVGSPPPPARHGGVSQTTAVEVVQGNTTPAYFAYSIHPDCSANGLPDIKIDRQPMHGSVQVVPHIDVARLSPDYYLESCGDKKVSGLALAYTPARIYLGWDLVEFDTITKEGNTHFAIAVHVTKKPNSVEQSKTIFEPYCNQVQDPAQCN